ncbi:MAG: hypothetical protein MIL41_04165 [Hyphomicrobiales bacterium]|jgi:hypothetical protein
MTVAARRAALFIGILASVLAVGSAAAQPEPAAPTTGMADVRDRTTRSLEAACLAEQGEASGWCSAYLIGVADTLAAFGNGGNKGGICRADYIVEQLPEIFLTWVRGNAMVRNLDMLAGASLAFRARWPC